MRLHFREQGDGPPLIILHGLFGSLDNWGYISLRLSEQFRVISVDQRNHGQSPHDPEINYAIMADDLREFMDQQHLASAHVLGHSMGGKTAMQFALTHPERVERLIVVDIAPRRYEPKHDEIFDALLSLDLDRYQTRAEVETALEPKLPDLGVRRFLLKGLARKPAGGFVWKFNLPALQKNYPALTAGLDIKSSFPKPALFIRGSASDYVREEDLGDLRQSFPRAELATIPEASHWVHAEKPEDFLRETLRFLSPII